MACAVIGTATRGIIPTRHDGAIDFELAENTDHETQLATVVREAVHVCERGRVWVEADFEARFIAARRWRRPAYVKCVDQCPVFKVVGAGGFIDAQEALAVDESQSRVDVVDGLEVHGHKGDAGS